ncbi:MAG: MurR/RpiR family transcriptional regulator [Acetivibrionales bacterium]|jgi:RpiR family carbohydrate utilization transcriptional regulator
MKPNFEINKRIQSKYSKMSKSEKLIADFIMKDPREVLSGTVFDLAKRTNTSGASVVRFCREIGFKGFSELKFQIERNMLSLINGDDQIELDDDIGTIKDKVIAYKHKVLDDIYRSLDNEQLERAVEALAFAKTIHIYAEGGSGSMAYCASNSFIHTGLYCQQITDASTQVMSAAYLKKGDVALGLTHSGEIKNTIDALKVARENGATTICITGHKNSSVTKCADIVLATDAKMPLPLSDLPAARLSELCLISILQIGVLTKAYDRFSGKSKKVKKAVRLKRLHNPPEEK